jgi:hypothetical protein
MIAVIIALLATTRAFSQGWDTTFGSTGPNGIVNAIAADHNAVYVGGEFTEIGGIKANNIARWNGSVWEPLGEGVNGEVNAIAVSPLGVFVGGDFDSAGGTICNHIAKWDKTMWTALTSNEGNGVNRAVKAIVVDTTGKRVYIGGTFTTIPGSGTTSGIASYALSTSTWRAVGGEVRIEGASWGEVNALALDGQHLYVGGQFNYVGVEGLNEITANSIAEWNILMQKWSSLGSGLEGFGGSQSLEVLSIAVDNDIVYVGGGFFKAGSEPAENGARWDRINMSWSALGGTVGYGEALTARNGQVYIGSTSQIEELGDEVQRINYTGQLESTDSKIKGNVLALAITDNGDLYVGGSFATAGGGSVKNLVRLTSGAASILPVAPSNNISLSITPNPMTTAGAVRFGLEHQSYVRVSIFNLLGQEIETALHGTLEAGEHVVPVATTDLSTGLYLVRLDVNGNQITRPLFVK